VAPPALLPRGSGSSSGGEGGRIHGTGKPSSFIDGEVVLEASGVERRSRRCNLKRAADIEMSSLCSGIRATMQCSYSEGTRHHDGLTHRASLHRSLLHLASRGHAACPWPLHLHMVLSLHELMRAVGGPSSYWGHLALHSLERARLRARLLGLLSVYWILGFPGPPAPGPLQRQSFGLRCAMKTEAQQGRPS
jgi:hypothetical protein